VLSASTKAGKLVQVANLVLSPDGRTLTVATRGVDATGQPVNMNTVAVYDKQWIVQSMRKHVSGRWSEIASARWSEMHQEIPKYREGAQSRRATVAARHRSYGDRITHGLWVMDSPDP
jgi:hypothetical protein